MEKTKLPTLAQKKAAEYQYSTANAHVD